MLACRIIYPANNMDGIIIMISYLRLRLDLIINLTHPNPPNNPTQASYLAEHETDCVRPQAQSRSDCLPK